MPRIKFNIDEQPGSYAVWLGSTGQVPRMEAFLRWIESKTPAAPPKHVEPKLCICQRMYDTGHAHFTAQQRLHSGVLVEWNIDRQIADLETDWFRRVYDAFAFGKSYTDPDSNESDVFQDPENGRTLPAPPELVKLKNRIEGACPAGTHYPRLSLDAELGRDVTVSSDSEKRDEALRGMEDSWFDSSHPWMIYGRRESRGADAGAGHSDVLQRQHEAAGVDVKPKAGTLRLSADVEQAASTAERKAFRTIQREDKPSPFLRLVWSNKRRVRAKEEQARRDLFTILRKLGRADDTEAIAWVRASVARHGYVATRARIWHAKAPELVRVRGDVR